MENFETKLRNYILRSSYVLLPHQKGRNAVAVSKACRVVKGFKILGLRTLVYITLCHGHQ